MKDFFNEKDKQLFAMLKEQNFLHKVDPFSLHIDSDIYTCEVHRPTAEYRFLHESAIIEYKGVLFASWYNNAQFELQGRCPIRGTRSYDGGKTWTDVEVIADDEGASIMYCPPVYGISFPYNGFI